MELEPKKVCKLLPTFLCVVHCDFGALFRACSHGLAHILSGCFGVFESFFRSVSTLDNDGLALMVHLDDRPLGDFNAVFADFADFQASFLGTLPRLMNHYLCSFLEPIEPFFRSLVSGSACDLNRVFRPIRCLHYDSLRLMIHLCYRSMDHTHDILGDAEKYCHCKTQCKTSEVSHFVISSLPKIGLRLRHLRLLSEHAIARVDRGKVGDQGAIIP